MEEISNYFNEVFSIRRTNWLRGGAAYLLIIVHTLQSFWAGGAPFLIAISKCGYLIVSVFFFLSGYALMFNAQRDVSLKNFVKKKIFRICLPAYYIELIYCIMDIGTTQFSAFKFITFYYVSFSWYIITLCAIYFVYCISGLICLKYKCQITMLCCIIAFLFCHFILT